MAEHTHHEHELKKSSRDMSLSTVIVAVNTRHRIKTGERIYLLQKK